MPSVSVIIPNFNHAPFLGQRIDSVLSQTFQDFEIIILDDCSADSSRDVIEDYRHHPKVSHIVYNSVNSGSAFKQWEKGINLAKGEFVWIAESDDYAGELFLSTLMKCFSDYPQVGLIYCQSDVVAESGEFLRNNKSWTDDLDEEKWNEFYTNSGVEEIRSSLSKKNTIPNASAVLIRKELFSNNFEFPVKMQMLGDWMCWVMLLRKTDLAFIPETFNYFRSTQSSTRIHNTPEKVCKRILEELMILNYLLKEKLISSDIYTIRVQAMLVLRLKGVKLWAILNLCWREIYSNIFVSGKFGLIVKSVQRSRI